MKEEFPGSTGYPTEHVRHCLGRQRTLPLLQELLAHPQVWYEPGKALGLNKERVSQSEGFDSLLQIYSSKYIWRKREDSVKAPLTLEGISAELISVYEH